MWLSLKAALQLTFCKNSPEYKKKRDGKLGRECGETEWKRAASVVIKAAALPLHVLSSESKIRTVFGEFAGKETQQLTYCCGWRVEG